MKSTSVKLFVSSTFLDMQAERDYLMGVIVPKLTTICNERGLNFFCYDLRWGITPEQQERNGTIFSCLNAVDESRPFFVGLIGERYGWIPEAKECEVLRQFDISEDDISITEMEMLYGALNIQSTGFCSFYLREKSASGQFCETDPSRINKLNRLKDRIRKSKYPCYDGYKTAQEFGDQLFYDFVEWLYSNFPDSGDVEYNKQITYMKRQSSVMLGNREIEKNIPLWLKKGNPLFIHKKDTALDSLFQSNQNFISNPEFFSIHVHLRASNILHYAENIVLYILRRIEELLPNTVEETYLNMPLPLIKSEKERQSIFKYFRYVCGSISPDKPIYIFLTDAHLLKREIDRTFYYFLNTFNPNINIVVSAEECLHKDLLDSFGWHIRQITMEDDLCEILMREKFRQNGKTISEHHLTVLREELNLFHSFEETEILSEMFIQLLTNDTLDKTISMLEEMSWVPIPELVRLIIFENLNDIEKSLFSYTCYLLNAFDFCIPEGDLQLLLYQFVDFSSSEWTNFIMYSKPLFPIVNGNMIITNPDICGYLKNCISLPEGESSQSIDNKVISWIWERIAWLLDSPEKFGYYQNINLILCFYRLCLENERCIPICELFNEHIPLLGVIAKFDIGFIRRLISAVPEAVQQEILRLFEINTPEIYDTLMEVENVSGKCELYFSLLAFFTQYDYQKILSEYVGPEKYYMIKTCSEDYTKLFTNFLNLLCKVNSQNLLDLWYKTSSESLAQYTYIDLPESTYTFKLFSIYADAYGTAQFAIKMAYLYYLSSANNGNIFEMLLALVRLKKSYSKSNIPVYQNAVIGLEDTINLLRDELGFNDVLY